MQTHPFHLLITVLPEVANNPWTCASLRTAYATHAGLPHVLFPSALIPCKGSGSSQTAELKGSAICPPPPPILRVVHPLPHHASQRCGGGVPHVKNPGCVPLLGRGLLWLWGRLAAQRLGWSPLKAGRGWAGVPRPLHPTTMDTWVRGWSPGTIRPPGAVHRAEGLLAAHGETTSLVGLLGLLADSAPPIRALSGPLSVKSALEAGAVGGGVCTGPTDFPGTPMVAVGLAPKPSRCRHGTG